MANFDEIFKSDLTEQDKLAKSIFGKLLILLRKNNHMKLYSLMNGVSDTKMQDNVIKLIFDDKIAYDMANNPNDLETLKSLLGDIDKGLSLKIENGQAKTFDEYKFVEYLKDEFGKILTIKWKQIIYILFDKFNL